MVLYSFVTISVFRILNGHWEPVKDLPQNVLIAMGLSTTTMVAAKHITTGYAGNGLVDKAESNDQEKFWSEIFNDDNLIYLAHLWF